MTEPKDNIVRLVRDAETLSDGKGAAPAGASAPNDDETKTGDSDTDIQCAFLPRTDLGNAKRFIKRFGDLFLYVEQWGWLAWDGRRWNTHDADAILSRAVHDMIVAIADEARAMEDSDSDTCLDEAKDIWTSDKLFAWCIASQSNAHVSCVARLAQAYLTAPPESFDADPAAFNLDNGTLRVARHETEPYLKFTSHNPLDRITKLAGCAYDKKAACPQYNTFLDRVQPDAKMQRHLHAWGGVSMTGLPLAKMSIWWGLGRNGKGTAAEAWAHVAGDYAQSIAIESFLDEGRSRRGGEASPDIASLPGVRLLRTSEPKRGSKLAEDMIKLVTGGDKITARHLNRDFFEFFPTFKLTMQGNHKPRIDGVDNGIWSRVLLVPWLITVPEGEQDLALPAKLKTEASGILNRLLDGLCDYLDHGLSPTDEVLAATADYRHDSDPVGEYIKDCTEAREPMKDEASGKLTEWRVSGKEIFETYMAWAKAHGERPWSHKAFSRGLQDHGIRRIKSSGIYYLGLVMTKGITDFDGMEIADPWDKKRP